MSRAARRGLYTVSPPSRPFAGTGSATDRPLTAPQPILCQPFERPTRPTHPAAESRRAHHAARHGHGRLVVRWASGSRSAEQPSGAARRGEAVSARGRWRVHSPPLSPPHPLFPRVLQAALRFAPGSSAALRPDGLRRLQPRLADSPTRCREVGETGALLPSLRSGRLRRPAREERDSSRRRTSPRRAGCV